MEFEINEFIKKHSAFIENNKDDLFNVEYRTLKPLNNEVFKFIKEVTGKDIKKISTSEFNIHAKNLNKVRSAYKKTQRKTQDTTNNNDININEQDYINNIYEEYGRNVCRKVIKFTKCYVFYQHPELYCYVDEGQNIIYRCKLSNAQVIWKPELHKERINSFIKRVSYASVKPITSIEEIKKLYYQIYCS
jgi:hypothetical protein